MSSQSPTDRERMVSCLRSPGLGVGMMGMQHSRDLCSVLSPRDHAVVGFFASVRLLAQLGTSLLSPLFSAAISRS